MDGGDKQAEMAKQLRRELRDMTPFRRRRFSHSNKEDESESRTGASKSESQVFAMRPAILHRDIQHPRQSDGGGSLGIFSRFPAWHKQSNPLEGTPAHPEIAELDRGLIMYYFDYFFPLLFPLYRPPLSEGGRSWMLDMVMQSQTMQQTTLCLSTYFFSLALETASSDHEACKVHAWKKLLESSNNAFRVLKGELKTLNHSNIQDHLPEAVRIIGGIMQLQRFEITACCFENCQAHLGAALALFQLILEGTTITKPSMLLSNFSAVMYKLRRSSWNWAVENIRVPSVDQAAFRFFSTLLIVDDIIASTALEKIPTLYKYHSSLLLGCGSSTSHEESPINIEAILGCQNWVMIQIGEIAALDAWKKNRRKTGELDITELAVRAKGIQDTLEGHLVLLRAASTTVPSNVGSAADIFTSYNNQPLTSDNERAFVTRVWAHAAIVYLSIVVSGWQTSNANVRHHVKSTIDLLVHPGTSPALLRTLVWPFCVAGCLAERAEESMLRDIVNGLRPPSVFGTMRKAIEIMENVWQTRETLDVGTWDLAAAIRSLGHFLLLV